MEKDMQACLRVLEEVRGPIAAQNNRGLERSARRLLAVARENKGNLYVRQEQFEKSLTEFAEAESLAESLCADEPGQLEYEIIAAKCGVNKGYTQLLLGDPGGAETTLTKTQVRLRNLRRRFPRDVDIAFALANCLSNRASASLLVMRSLPPAEAPMVLNRIEEDVQEAGQLLKGMEGNRKNADQVALLQGVNYLGLAMIRCQRQEWAEAIPWLNRGIDHFEATIKAGAANPEFAKRAVLLQGQRALSLYEMRKFPEALKDVDQVLSKQGDPVAFGLLRAGILARSGAHREGVAAVEKIVAGSHGQRPEVLMDAAGVFSVALEGLTRDGSLSEKDKGDQARVYGARAVDFLRQAVKAGYKNFDKIRNAAPAGDRDLEPLRGRDEFKRFLRELAAIKPKP
jgi:tetratricopeptide (TPR) repeat protein